MNNRYYEEVHYALTMSILEYQDRHNKERPAKIFMNNSLYEILMDIFMMENTYGMLPEYSFKQQRTIPTFRDIPVEVYVDDSKTPKFYLAEREYEL